MCWREGEGVIFKISYWEVILIRTTFLGREPFLEIVIDIPRTSSNIVTENYFSSAVPKILQYTQTDRQTHRYF